MCFDVLGQLKHFNEEHILYKNNTFAHACDVI